MHLITVLIMYYNFIPFKYKHFWNRQNCKYLYPTLILQFFLKLTYQMC